jgi:uncharacterized protein (DUF2147 family)
MTKNSWRSIAGPVLLASLLLASIRAAAAGPQGIWLTEDGGGAVEIFNCGAVLCGRIVWQRSPLRADGSLDTDDRNPNPALRQKPICGLQIISEMRATGPAAWGEGRIYDPDSGKTYQATMALDDADVLRLRGYVGVPLLGASQLWQRAPAGLALCTEPKIPS